MQTQASTHILSPSADSEFWMGVRRILLILPSIIPFGILYGTLAMTSGLPANIVMAMSSIVFAGSAQLLATPLLAGGASWVVILLTTLVINLRHALYGVSLARYLGHLSKPWKWILAYLMTDEAYATAIVHFDQQQDFSPRSNTHWFYFGSALAMWLCWQISTAIGIFFGANIPASWGLDFALPLTFIALVIPMLTDRSAVTAALISGLAALLLAGLPLKLGLFSAMLVGIGAGMLVYLTRMLKEQANPVAAAEDANLILPEKE
jgi:4-azaleucine resistance transporter AzlC